MMGRYLSFALAGLLFGAGLTVSGMVNPMKVLNFLDLAGQWDATLITVMGGGLAVTLIGYRIIFARQKPLFAAGFLLPGTSVIDAKLLGGAALFGAGWGLSGFCPGPAIASLVFGNSQTFVFIAAMAAGALLMRLAQHHAPSKKELAEVEG
jgi:uncharacterized protein